VRFHKTASLTKYAVAQPWHLIVSRMADAYGEVLRMTFAIKINSRVNGVECNPDPTDADIDHKLADNICRHGMYARVHEAVRPAARSDGQEE
jgi:hypothetical protein